MYKQNNYFVLKGLIAAVICAFAFSNVFAAASAKDSRAYSMITKNLSKKLQNDMANDAVIVKVNNIKEYKISKTQIGFVGDGFCVTDENTQLPIRFEAKINTAKQIVSDISYDFVETAAPSVDAPNSNEEVLMKELMKQISRDYKTENIVIAIDGFEDVSKITDKKEFTGVGEVRIGDFVWNKIIFDVVLDTQNQTANKVIYKVEK